MLPKGMIGQINQYYFNEPHRRLEFNRAFAEFFNVDSPRDYHNKEVPELHLGLLNEWFIFDYRHTNSKTTLQNYLAENRRRLAPEKVDVLEDLLLTNRYSMFEVQRVDRDKGLRLYDLHSGKTYEVMERQGTHDIHVGNVFPTRVSKIHGQWEIVSAPTIIIPVHLQDGARAFFKNSKEILNPKTIFHSLLSPDRADNETRGDYPDDIAPDVAKARLEEMLRQHKLDQFITIDTIASWLKDIDENKRTLTEVISLIVGLAYKTDVYQDMQTALDAIVNFYNTLPKKSLRGKSPQEKTQEGGFGSKGFSTDITEISSKDIFDALEQAHAAMLKNDFTSATEAFNNTFRLFLERKTTLPDIYRIYANAAICHFGAGMEFEGKILLETALKLNPNYDFAVTTKEKYDNGEYAEMIICGAIARAKKDDALFDRWDFLAIRKDWSEEKMLTQLATYGIHTTKKLFLAEAKKHTSTHDLSEEVFYPQYTGLDDWNEDFVWMATFALWERWALKLPALDILEDAFNNLVDLLFENNATVKSVDGVLRVLEDYLTICDKKFITAWKNSNHYISDLTIFMESASELLNTDNRQRIITIAAGFHRLTGDDFWKLVIILDKQIHSDAAWQTSLEDFVSTFPYTPLPYMLAAWIYLDKEDHDKEIHYLWKALATVEKREQEQPAELSYHNNDVLSDYEHILSALEDSYEESDSEEKIKEIESRLAEVQKRQEEEVDSSKQTEEFQRLEKHMEDYAHQRMKENPAMQYFHYLQESGINFKTTELTTTKLTDIHPEAQQKIGRNEPCPCGSGRKYKRCHGS